jgi:beta-glucosidase
MVLLKNEGDLLPLQSVCKVLVAGNFVHARSELFGTWAPDGREGDVVPLSQALMDSAPSGVELSFAEDPDKAMLDALDSDVVVLLLGEHPHRSGENANLSDLALPQAQAELIDRIVTLGKPVVLVVFAGRPLVLTRQASQVDALLFAWHPGIEGAAALGELLFGKYSPSGRLPITFPRATGQVPIYYNHKNSGRPVSPGGNFRTRYLDLPSSPLFPFGYGLSYTTFNYGDTQVSSPTLRGELIASVEVTNTSRCAGSELVQLYIRDLVGSLTRRAS